MIDKNFTRFIFSFVLIFSLFAVSLPQIGYAQTATKQTQTADDLKTRLAKIEEKTEARRKELGIPGMSLVIVKDGEIIYAKGFGYKDYEKQIPVSTDTQFAIGSATKAFTALSVLMSADEGKLSLDDSPKKYLPYFKMKDADTDAKMTVRDLMSHSSGLSRTDLAMVTGKLSRAELIQVAGEAKPVAKLREKFGYQNVMFAAAGEVVAQVQKQPWEKYVPERIFKPLGMNNSTMTIPEYEKAKDISFGYEYNFDTKQTRRLPFRPIDATNPAGSINSSANDMAKWLKLVLSGGTVNGRRLVSEKGFEEWTKPQMPVAGKTSYGLGWFLQDWKGFKVVQHGGNIDGFNSMVAMIPEKNLGFVMLTNVTGSPLGGEMIPLIWESILEEKKADATVKPALEAMAKMVGRYRFEAAKLDIEVKIENENLVMLVPGQPTSVLERTGERQFKPIGAPEGFAVKFTPAQGDATELYLQQPQGNYTLPRIGADGKVLTTQIVSTNNPATELVGKYKTPTGNGTVEIKNADGKITFNIEGQPPYALAEKSKDEFSLSPLPDTYFLKVKRTSDGKTVSVVITQPEGEFEFKRDESKPDDKPQIRVDEVMAKTIDALGGAENWKKLTSRETKFEMDFENQGVKGFGTEYEKSSNMSAAEVTMTALGKNIATSFEYFDGNSGGETVSFAPAETYTGQRLEDAKYESDFYGLLNWKNGLKSAEVTGKAKVGDEEVYVVKFTPEKASEFTYHISQKTFLPLKKLSVIVSSTSSQKMPITQTFSDYRAADGVMFPFKTISVSPSMGDIVIYLKEIKHNISIDDSKFKPKK